MAAQDDDELDALLVAMKSFEISKNSLWPSCVYSIQNKKEEEEEEDDGKDHVIAKLDECFLPEECYAWLPFPKPQTKDNSIERHMLAKALSDVIQLPLFAVFSIVTPTLMLISSGTPLRAKVHYCDDVIARLRRIYKEDFHKYGGSLADFAKLPSSRIIIDQVKRVQLDRMSYARTSAISERQFTHSWPKHSSTFAALHLYRVMIITIMSLSIVNSKSKEEQERLNTHYNELDERLGELFQEYMREDEMHVAISHAHRQLDERSTVYGLIVPTNLVSQMRSYTYRVLELFERCVMSMIEIPRELQDKLVCTCQRRLTPEEEPDYATRSLLVEQSNVFVSRCQSNPRIWTFNQSLSSHSATRLLYRRRPYHEWLMLACAHYTQSAQKIKKNLDYQRRVALGQTTSVDNDWSTNHSNFNEQTNSVFRSIH